MEPEKKPDTMVDQAHKAAERIEAANKRMEENIQKMEQLKAEQVLSGRAAAGQEPPEPKPETPAEYKDRIMKGELRGEEGRYH